MTPSYLGDAETLTRTQTATQGASGAPRVLLPGLTLLYHPDVERVGERTLLAGLESGREILLSRHQGDFASPSGGAPRPLEDPRLSRSPLRFAAGEDGAVALDVSETRTRVVVDGRPIRDRASFQDADLGRGVVLLLGSHVVLLLRRLDPMSEPGGERWGLVGEAPAMVRVRQDIRQVADLDVPVLIRGESGSGKELVARGIHDAGPRRVGPYVVVNMAAIPASLAAAELFGAVKGAFTGADRRRAGYFGRAHGGTLFLDEIGETPSEIQALLLRALETGEIQPVGAEQAAKVDVRVISATDADLEVGISDQRFRAPLLHRLSGYGIDLPPLRDRREDFGRLFVHFLRRELEKVGEASRIEPRQRPWLAGSWVARLAGWHWPGNVRQLANVVRQLVIANRGADPAVRFEAVERLLRQEDPVSASAEGSTPSSPLPARALPAGPRRPSDITAAQLLDALRAHRFRPAAAARALGIPRSSIYDLMERNPEVRKASELSANDVESVREVAAGSVERAAELLEVSAQALRRRLGQLGLKL